MDEMVVLKGDYDWTYVRTPITKTLREKVAQLNQRLDEMGQGDDRITIEEVGDEATDGLGDDLLWDAGTDDEAAEMIEAWVEATG